MRKAAILEPRRAASTDGRAFHAQNLGYCPAGVSGSIESIEDPAGPVIALTGDIDVNSEADLGLAIVAAAGRGNRVVIDVSRTTMLDSRTMGVLATWAGRLRERGGGVSIVVVGGEVLRLFRTIGLEREFEFFDSREAAWGAAQ